MFVASKIIFALSVDASANFVVPFVNDKALSSIIYASPIPGIILIEFSAKSIASFLVFLSESNVLDDKLAIASSIGSFASFVVSLIISAIVVFNSFNTSLLFGSSLRACRTCNFLLASPITFSLSIPFVSIPNNVPVKTSNTLLTPTAPTVLP